MKISNLKVEKKFLVVLFSLFLIIVFLGFSKNIAFSQTCEEGNVICPNGQVACCEKFKPHCKDGEVKCCKKKADGSGLKCQDKNGNSFPVECKDSCSEEVDEVDTPAEVTEKTQDDSTTKERTYGGLGGIQQDKEEPTKEADLKAQFADPCLIYSAQVAIFQPALSIVCNNHCINDVSRSGGIAEAKFSTQPISCQPPRSSWDSIAMGLSNYSALVTSIQNDANIVLGSYSNLLACFSCCCNQPIAAVPTPPPMPTSTPSSCYWSAGQCLGTCPNSGQSCLVVPSTTNPNTLDCTCTVSCGQTGGGTTGSQPPVCGGGCPKTNSSTGGDYCVPDYSNVGNVTCKCLTPCSQNGPLVCSNSNNTCPPTRVCLSNGSNCACGTPPPPPTPVPTPITNPCRCLVPVASNGFCPSLTGGLYQCIGNCPAGKTCKGTFVSPGIPFYNCSCQ